MTPEANPYAAPQVETVPVIEGDRGDALSIRRAHLRHEAGLRSLGALWLFGGAVMVIMSLYLLTADEVGALVSLTALVLGAGFLVCANDVRQLKPRARVTGSILATLSLFNVPMGTLIGLYAFHLLHSEKGRVVLDADYARIRELTPDVKHRTSIIVWIALALLVGVIAIAALGSVFS